MKLHIMRPYADSNVNALARKPEKKPLRENLRIDELDNIYEFDGGFSLYVYSYVFIFELILR